MPTIDPKTGQITLSMEEFASMQSGGKPAEDTKTQSMLDKWREKFAPKKQEEKPAGGNGNQGNGGAGNGGKPALTREALLEATKSMEFFKPTQEQLEAIGKGDMSAFMAAQQDALRNVFVDAALASNSLVDRSTTSSKSEMERMIAEQLSRHEGARSIKEKTSKYLEAPGGDVLVSALTRQFSQNHPDKPAAEVGEMVNGFLSDFSSNFGKQADQPNAREVATKEAQASAADF